MEIKLPKQNVVPMKKTEEKFPLEPFSDIVVIEQLEEEKSRGGILLVGSERKFAAGRVVAVGPGRVYSDYMDASGQRQFGQIIPTSVKVGDWVCFGKYQSGGEPILLNGKKYLMAREGDLGGRSTSGDPLEIKLAVDQE